MKIQIVSDLHLEFGPLELAVEEADILVAAGDIGLGYEGLKWLQGVSCPVIYVAGNHEYWGQDIDELNDTLTDITQQGRVRFLEHHSVVIDDTRFIGCTLWTDFNASDPLVMSELFFMMNDFRYITRGNRSMRPDELAAINRASRVWLDKELSEPFNGKTVVVTHHAPLMRSWFCGRNEIIQYAYCNDLSELMAKHSIDIWIHGHVHEAFDYMAHGVRVVCNPRGYYRYKEVLEFEPAKIVNL